MGGLNFKDVIIYLPLVSINNFFMNKHFLTCCLTLITAMLLSNCGKNYDEVNIGYQVWMTKNLDVATFRNGDPIPDAKTNEEWKKAEENKRPAWCYYDNDPTNGEKYGKLYNWYAVNDPRGLAPEGWHIPSDAEWSTLTDFLAVENENTCGWNENGVYTTHSGFSGHASGQRRVRGTFGYLGINGTWWSSTEKPLERAWFRFIKYNYRGIIRSHANKAEGFSVRCIKD